MGKTVVILCVWLLLAPIVSFFEPNTFKLMYSITMVLLSFLLWHTYKGSKWILLPFILSVPPFFTFTLSLFIPTAKDLADKVGLLAVLGGVFFALTKIAFNHARTN